MFTPENRLEECLVAATSDPAARPEFYRQLVAADILIIDEGAAPETHGQRTLETGHELKIRSIEVNGESYLPIFSSLARLQAVIQSEVTYLAMNALELMKVTRGARLLLNPGSDYGKEFLPEEIESIVDGSIWRPDASYTTEQDTQVLLGQPARYPEELVQVLKRVFEGNANVNGAWLAHFFNPASGEPAHTLVAIDADGDWEQVVSEAGIATNGVTVPDPPVDFIRLRGSSLESYFSSVEPFYERGADA